MAGVSGLLHRVDEIRVPRRWAAPCLAGCLVFTAMCASFSRDPSEHAWTFQLGLVCAALGAVAFAWLLARPPRLLLDDEGFTLGGGFVRAPKKIRWLSVDEFFVYRLPRGGKMIGFNFVPGESARSTMAKLSHRLGVDACLPKGWPVPAERMVDELNARRLRALRDA